MTHTCTHTHAHTFLKCSNDEDEEFTCFPQAAHWKSKFVIFENVTQKRKRGKVSYLLTNISSIGHNMSKILAPGENPENPREFFGFMAVSEQ